jgi:23S rRNA (cytosine1962-C5)-methyltransferase
MSLTSLRLEILPGFAGYELLDMGEGRKLERFGDIIVNRPEPQAMTLPGLSKTDWDRADAVFDGADDDEAGKWALRGPVPESWAVPIDGRVKAVCRLASFRHMGLFPEQMPHWHWMMDRLRDRKQARVLNLFGYTGVASLLAADAGAAEIVHVDASKKAITWGRENQAESRLDKAPIRWICEDARKFVAREVRRERQYDCILIDPPKFGRGAEGEVWDLFLDLPEFLRDCAAITAPDGCVILTSYAIRASALSMHNLMQQNFKGGVFDTGELALQAKDGRLLGTSLFTRWSAQ